mmetsp:Transcript_30013/g.42195  ORF Transcript_30013/g.42195 Transcript_30013/m.42195 type:complete len:139 (+) Transcript_30013:98-514(+)
MASPSSSLKDVYVRMVNYHAWAYKKLIECITELSDEEYKKDVGLFFKSVHGTLNHLLLADGIWYKRIAQGKPTPEAKDLGQELYSSRDELIKAVSEQSQMWIEYVESLSEEDLLGNFSYVDGRKFSSSTTSNDPTSRF